MSRTASCLGCMPCHRYVCARKDRWRGRAIARSRGMPRDHMASNTPDSIANLHHTSYSVLLLSRLWIYVVSFVSREIIVLLHHCMKITLEDSWKPGKLHPKENPSTPHHRKRKQNPANSRKKKQRRGVFGSPDWSALDSYIVCAVLPSNQYRVYRSRHNS